MTISLDTILVKIIDVNLPFSLHVGLSSLVVFTYISSILINKEHLLFEYLSR
jgi:hypothetical protein